MGKSFNANLLELLKQDNRFMDSNGELLKKSVIDKAWKTDHSLIKLLLGNSDTKKKFFDEIAGHWVFNINTFIEYISDKNFLDNSYTRFRNKIGLNIDSKFMRERGEVCLVWPYKDCVLEGGQTKEEENRKEIFFNEILAQDEIDRLFDPKVLTNWKRYTSKGEEKVTKLKRDDKGTIKENLIIKGNNLLALHTLKQQFQGKVKLIYIDPPYNTGSDSFKYNDSFNHSSWLTFMKNRLEVAKDLLRKDGVIFVQCDDSEQAYLKVLMDEVFGADAFLNTISVKAKVSAGASGGGEDKKIKKNIEYIHCYFNNSFVIFKDIFKETEITKYIESMKINNKSFKYTNVLISKGQKKYLKEIKDGSGEKIEIYRHFDVEIKTVSQIEKEENISTAQIYRKYFDKVFTTTNAQSSIRQRVWEATDKNSDFYSIKYKPKSGRDKGKWIEQYYTGNKKVLLIWFKNTAFIDESGNVVKKEKYGTFWDGIDYNNLNKEGNTVFRSGKKPEQLLKRIIEMSTEKGDIVLDYHLGSGTTVAVAHKMGRQYIGVEQLGYGNSDSVVRLNNVIKGDPSGISKFVDWKGNGNFLFCELMKYNEVYMDKVQTAKSSKELVSLWKDISKNSFLNWYINPEVPEEALKDFIKIGEGAIGTLDQRKAGSSKINSSSKIGNSHKSVASQDELEEWKNQKYIEKTFRTVLSGGNTGLEKQKRLLAELLNKNQLYVNLSEIDDKDFQVSTEDKKLNNLFFSEN